MWTRLILSLNVLFQGQTLLLRDSLFCGRDHQSHSTFIFDFSDHYADSNDSATAQWDVCYHSVALDTIY